VPLSRDFLGFWSAACPGCHGSWAYPLSTGYRVGYVVLALVYVALFVAAVVGGWLSPANVIFGVAILGLSASSLVRDYTIRRNPPPALDPDAPRRQ